MISITWARNAAQLATQRAQTCRPERRRAGRQRLAVLGGDRGQRGQGTAVSPENPAPAPTELVGCSCLEFPPRTACQGEFLNSNVQGPMDVRALQNVSLARGRVPPASVLQRNATPRCDPPASLRPAVTPFIPGELPAQLRVRFHGVGLPWPLRAREAGGAAPQLAGTGLNPAVIAAPRDASPAPCESRPVGASCYFNASVLLLEGGGSPFKHQPVWGWSPQSAGASAFTDGSEMAAF